MPNPAAGHHRAVRVVKTLFCMGFDIVYLKLSTVWLVAASDDDNLLHCAWYVGRMAYIYVGIDVKFQCHLIDDNYAIKSSWHN